MGLCFMRHGGQRGQIAVLFALVITALIGFLALGVDAGRAYVERRRLQNAADAAVLAGVQQLALGNRSNAALAAVQYAQRNGVPDTDGNAANDVNANVSIEYIDANDNPTTLQQAVGLRIVARKPLNMLFAGLTGPAGAEFSAGAVAKYGTPAGQAGLAGFAVYDATFVPGGTYYLWGPHYDQNNGPPPNAPSDFKGRVDFNDRLDASGQPYSSAPNQSFEYYVANGYPNVVWLGDRIATLSGVGSASDALRTYINNHAQYDVGGKYTIVVVPVYNTFTPGTPNRVTVSCFAAFKIYEANVGANEARGIFVSTVRGTYISYSGADFGVKVVKLTR